MTSTFKGIGSPKEFLQNKPSNEVSELVVSNNGQTSATLAEHAKDILIQLGTETACLYGPSGLSSFQVDETTKRVHLDLHVTDVEEQ